MNDIKLELKLKDYMEAIPRGYFHTWGTHRHKDCIRPEDMEIGFYECAGRNFYIGYWDGKEFKGLRTKFGGTFITNEIHWDLDKRYGTVQPLKVID